MKSFDPSLLLSTYSIVAHDPETGYLGGAVQTHVMGVGRLIPFALPGYGVVASQSWVNIHYNSIALQMLREGIAPQQIIDGLTASDPDAHRRQVAVINHRGEAAAFSGEGCIREFGHVVGENYSIQANMMTRTTVIDAMQEAYEQSSGDLAARMLAALEAAQVEDGDIRGMQSAAMKIVPGSRDVPEWESLYDLRVDEHQKPLEELARLIRFRRAGLIDAEGHAALAEGDTETAFAKWKEARELTPDQEELAFWQAVMLNDQQPIENATQIAAQIYASTLKDHERSEHWLDLIKRLGECGLIAREGAADELLSAIQKEIT